MPPYTVTVAPIATAQIEAALLWWSRNRPASRGMLANEVDRALELIEHVPQAGRRTTSKLFRDVRRHRTSAAQREVRAELAVREAPVRTRTRYLSVIRALLRREGIRVPSGKRSAVPAAAGAGGAADTAADRPWSPVLLRSLACAR